MKYKEIVLIEDHHQALEAWRREKLKGLTLVHLDAHIDFEFYQAKPFCQIMEEAKSIKQIQEQLERTLRHIKYRKNLEAQLNIGNYIYPAMRDQIVNKFYWVVPGDKNEFRRSLKSIRRLVRRLKTEDPVGTDRIIESRDRLSTRLYKNYFEVTSILSLKKIREPILLDIDLDFLLFDSARNLSLTKNLGRRRPWIYPKELVRYIKKKLPRIAYTTISYSVNGGFTPLEYEFFGDEIVIRLKAALDKRLEEVISFRDDGIKEYSEGHPEASLENFEEAVRRLGDYERLDSHTKANFFAHLYFWFYTIYWKLGEKDTARAYYKKLLRKRPAYRRKDNNSGWLYLRKKDLNTARKEFERVFDCDGRDYFSLCGLGEIFYQRKKYRKALDRFQQASRINPYKKEALFGALDCQIALGSLKQAKKTLSILKKKEPVSGSTFFMEGRLQKRLGNYKRSLLAYKEAVILGRGDIELYNDVFDMLKVERDKGLLRFFKQGYGGFKRDFYRSRKKTPLKGERRSGFKREIKIIKRIDKILKTLFRVG